LLHFVTVAGKERTHRTVARRLGSNRFRTHTYQQLLRARLVPWGTWIFSDFDRLSASQLRRVVAVAEKLRESGATVVNDPTQILQRTSLLRTLRREGINSFDVWRLPDGERPDRFPVFIRGEADHFGPLTELLHDGDELEAALEELLAGHQVALHDLIAVEYRAETIDGERFRKMAAYRVGDRIVPGMIIINTHWRAKEGTVRIATQEDYDHERELHAAYPWGDVVRRAFELASIEYGRADFGIVRGRPEIYEINTNPMMTDLKTHWNDTKMATFEAMIGRYDDAILALDATPGPTDRTVRLRPDPAPDPPLTRRSRIRLRLRRVGAVATTRPRSGAPRGGSRR
jgi:hypothetical protein